jgi:sec-independent protein translocase protein TatA
MFEGLFRPSHLLIILAIVLIVFGPSKLPHIGGALGKSIRDFKKAMNEPSAEPPDQVTITTTAQNKDVGTGRVEG